MLPNVLVVNANKPAKTLADLVAQAKAAPDTTSFGCNGHGTAQHSIGAQFEAMTGAPTAHIPCKGSGPLATGLIGGQITTGFDIGSWFGVLARKGTPRDIVVRLNGEIVKILQSADSKQRMAEIGAEVVGNTAGQMAAQVKADTERFAKPAKDAKVVID